MTNDQRDLMIFANEMDRLETIKIAAKPKGPGWEKTPGAHGDGMRRKSKGGGWEYWYPSAEKAAEAASAHHKAHGASMDKAEAAGAKKHEAQYSADRSKWNADFHKGHAKEHAQGSHEQQMRMIARPEGGPIGGYGEAKSNKAHHDEAHKHHSGEAEKHSQVSKEHAAKAKGHKDEETKHKDEAADHADAAAGAAAFAAQKKPSMWDKVKGLFGGKKKEEPKPKDKNPY